jgi:hypothetical protein
MTATAADRAGSPRLRPTLRALVYLNVLGLVDGSSPVIGQRDDPIMLAKVLQGFVTEPQLGADLLGTRARGSRLVALAMGYLIG